ncbi:MAG: hypothetical protein MRY64_12860 [Hyphomonadaceae bacterium]|nr:hypothetical protein [Hyphomonadaceae bacterium]
MSRVWKGLGLILFLLIGAYGLTKFLDAHKVRAVLADAEAFCADHDGVGEIESDDGVITSLSCEDGTLFPLGLDGG